MTTSLAKALPDNPMNLWFLLLFIAIFSVILVWSLRPSRQKKFEELSKLPLND